MKRIEAVIFDMDGVLLDTERICRICWTRAAGERGMDGIDQAYRACIGMNVPDTLDLLKKQYGAGFDAKSFYERTSALFHVVETEQGIPLMPDVVDSIEKLIKSGYRAAVASSTRTATVHRQLKAAGLFGYFETITCGDTVVHSKPAPDIYLKACSSLNLPPDRCAAVEDSPNGIKSASAAGMKCIMVPDQIKPTEAVTVLTIGVCSSLADVPDLLERQMS